MKYYCPKDFKNGKYYFNKYDIRDLLILVPVVVIGTLLGIVSISNMAEGNFNLSMIGLVLGISIVCFTFILLMPFKMFHNILQRLIVELHFMNKQKEFLWYGVDFNNYEE